MRKTYAAMLALALFAALPATGWAAVTRNMTSGETFLEYFSGYEVYKYYDFYNYGSALSDGHGTETVTVNSTAYYPCTYEGLENICLYYVSSTNYVVFRNYSGNYNYGIFNFASGSRTFALGGLKAGMIVIVEEIANSSSYSVVGTAVGGESLTDSIHTAQGDDAYSYYYFRVTDDLDGYLVYTLGRACYVPAITILKATTTEEEVEAPTLKLSAVDGTSRTVTVTDGESSVTDNTVTTYYTLDGSTPTSSSTAVTNGSITVSASDDTDSDGYVTVSAVSVSSGDVSSDVATLKVSVTAITLNSPTLTLSTLSGTSRGYTLGWTSNLLCNEDYSFAVTIDGEASTETYTTGSVIYATDAISVTVSATGYTSATTTLDDLADEGTSYDLLASDDASHTWDFQDIDDDILTLIKADESGWTYDSSKNRAWLDVNDAVDGYNGDDTGLLDGLTLTCGPSSYSTVAIYTNGSGLYLMVSGTIVVEDLCAGDYVVMSTSSGTTLVQMTADGDQTLSFSSGTYIYYIDVFSAGVSVDIYNPGYATLYYGSRNLQVPDGVTAYTVSSAEDDKAVLTAIEDGLIPAGTGVVLKASGSYEEDADATASLSYTLTAVGGSYDAIDDNLLAGTDEETTIEEDGYTYYQLALNSSSELSSIGFYYAAEGGSSITNGAHKAYLALSSESSVKSLSLVFADEATGIAGVSEGSATAVTEGIYSLQGVRFNADPQSLPAGLYIINGQKHLIK